MSKIHTSLTEIRSIVREQKEKPDGGRLGNEDTGGGSLERQTETLPTLTQLEMENFSKPEASEEIELGILGLPTKKSPSPIGFSCELTR